MTEEQFFVLMLGTMFDARRNKRYGRDSVSFERNWAPRLVRMSDELRAREFRIAENYAFLVSVPLWREILATCFEGRETDHLLCDTLRPYIERELHPRTFNNREGKGSQAAINQVIEDICEVTHGYTEPARIIKWDLRGFFPNAVCDVMERELVRVIDKYAAEISGRFGDEEMPRFLRWLAMILIHCCPASHCELRSPRRLWREHIKPEKSIMNKPPGIAAPIGRLVSQTCMGLYINDEVRWLNDDCGIRTTVFMDDGVMVVGERLHQYALSLLPELRRRLGAKGVMMNDRKFYDQPYEHGLEFLGSHIRPWSVILNDRTWERAVSRIEEFNALDDKYARLDSFVSTVNSYTGLLKNRTSYGRICQLRGMIGEEWWQWTEWDGKRQCVVCREAYSPNRRLGMKYHLKLKNRNGKGKRKERAAA